VDHTTLKSLLQGSDTILGLRRLVVTVQRQWAVDGENRLSYTTLIRLVECCREYHWDVDVAPHAGRLSLDSTIKTLVAEFDQPVPLDRSIVVEYYVVGVRYKSYSMSFVIRDAETGLQYGKVDTVNVFLDPARGTPKSPPEQVLLSLSEIQLVSR